MYSLITMYSFFCTPTHPQTHTTQGLNSKLPHAGDPLNAVGICFVTYALLIHDFTPPQEYAQNPFDTKILPRGYGVQPRGGNGGQCRGSGGQSGDDARERGTQPKEGTRLRQIVDWLAGGEYPPMIIFGMVVMCFWGGVDVFLGLG